MSNLSDTLNNDQIDALQTLLNDLIDEYGNDFTLDSLSSLVDDHNHELENEEDEEYEDEDED